VSSQDLPLIDPNAPPPWKPGTQSFLPAINEMDRVRREAWESSMREAIQTDPAVYADAVDLAKRTEQPIDFAQRNPDFLRQIAMLRSIREQKIESTNPALYSAMQSLHFAKLAIDDVPNLAFYERWSQGWTNGRLTVERGRAATKVMFGDASGIEELEKANREIAKQLPVDADPRAWGLVTSTRTQTLRYRYYWNKIQK